MLTEYQPEPEKTDSEYNHLKLLVDSQFEMMARQERELTELAVVTNRLRDVNAQLQVQLGNLSAHIEADHDFLKNTLGLGGLVTAHNPHIPPDIRTLHAALTDIRRAADDPYEAATDEDSVEYQFPESPTTVNS